MPRNVYIGLGSNLGRRRLALGRALALISAQPGIRLLEVSRLYETAPEGASSSWFLNAAAELETSLEPEELLFVLLETERSLGRDRNQAWPDRTLDLDLLLWQDLVYHTSTLELPHPRLHRRLFVLAPLCDLAADFVHPVLGLPLRQLAAHVAHQMVRPVDWGEKLLAEFNPAGR